MATHYFRCKECKRTFEDVSHYDDELGHVVGVSCECGSMAERIWLKAPATRFDDAISFPRELRNAARLQLGKDFRTRKEHDDYCRENGYEPISRKEFEERAISTPQMQVPVAESDDLEARLHDRLDQNFHKLINGDLPPQDTPPPDVVAEIRETAASIAKVHQGGQ